MFLLNNKICLRKNEKFSNHTLSVLTSSLLKSRLAKARSRFCLLIFSCPLLLVAIGTRSFDGDFDLSSSSNLASRRPFCKFNRTCRPGGIA